jgi:thiol-disulfide isomerase/thioredoxin
MVKKTLLLPLITLSLAATLFILYATVEKVNHKTYATENLKSLPSLALFDVDGDTLLLGGNRKTILIFFNSECDNCQHEVEQIVENKILFKDSHIVLMSSESMAAIKAFAEKNGSPEIVNMHFTKISDVQANEIFGNFAVPQIFIYGSDGHLLKHFTGETKIDAILYYL